MNAKHGYLICIIHIVGVSRCLILPGSVQIAYFPSNVDSFFTFVLHSAVMSICMQANLLTNVLRSLTKVLRSLLMSMAYHCSRICCKYAFLTNFRSMFLIFARPHECFRTPQACLRTPTNVLRTLRIGAELHSQAYLPRPESSINA